MSRSQSPSDNNRNYAAFGVRPARIERFFFFLALLFSLVPGSTTSVKAASEITFTAEEFLSRPEATSININVIPASAIILIYDYDTVSGGTGGTYSFSTTPVSAAAGTPCNVVINGLSPDQKYYYRMRYHIPSESDWVTRSEHSFHTQRGPGDTFSFVVTSDTHAGLGGNFFSTTRYNQTLSHILADHPDFWIDAGDTPKDDFLHSLTEYQNGYKELRGHIKVVSGDVPFFQVLGNHEQEMGWNLDDATPMSSTQPIMAVNARRAIIPNPKPDGFYSGNTDASLTYIDDDHLREDYYAWTWGDALFICLDPYWYTMKFPQENSTYPFGGEENQAGEAATKGTRWDWTLGIQQYLWLKNTLETSTSKYKFVFIHNVTGGIIPYGRGGTEIAGYFEWGGKNWDDTWGWDTYRPAAAGWTLPIHQLMDQYNVTIFFHGHDHFYAKQELDGIVYQEVPMPAAVDNFAGFMNEQTGTYASQYPDPARILFYDGAEKYPDSGHLRVTVSPTGGVTVDYVDMYDGSLTATYTVPAPGQSYNLTTAVSPAGSGTTNPAVGFHPYSENSVVTISAAPAVGYEFDHWEGDVADPGEANTTVTMNANKTVTAHFTVMPTEVKVSTKVFLEGPYSSGGMSTALNVGGNIPLAQPYSGSPWNYSGSESVASGFFASHTDIVDWVLVELRTGTASETKVGTRAAFLKSNGTIVDVDGSSAVAFSGIAAGNYYIVITHRNHLSVMSASAVSLTSGSATLYDFTTGSSQLYGTGGAKQLETGVWGLWSGDINQDKQITTTDYTDWYNSARAGDLGYHVTDCNCDGQVTTEDYAVWYNNARAGASSQIP